MRPPSPATTRSCGAPSKPTGATSSRRWATPSAPPSPPPPRPWRRPSLPSERCCNEDWGEVGAPAGAHGLAHGERRGAATATTSALPSTGSPGCCLRRPRRADAALVAGPGAGAGQLPDGCALRDLGEHRLKDLARPERVFQLVAPDLPADFPPLRTLGARPNNLPVQPTPLVGRGSGDGGLRGRGLLRGAEVRLLTLTGPGGTGKTRLALQVGGRAPGRVRGRRLLRGARHPSRDPDAGRLDHRRRRSDVRESGDQPLIGGPEGLPASDKRLLLVLDNFEQVLEAAPLVGRAAGRVPRPQGAGDQPRPAAGLRRAGVPGAAACGYPTRSACPPIDGAVPVRGGRALHRAGAGRQGRDFAVTDENAPAVAEICARLDGLPLAIELAAARVRLLPPQAMLGGSGSRLKLLTGGARDLPERQQTLRGAIDWSHTLLDEGERTLFARLAVFSGGCTLEADGGVCDAEGDLPWTPRGRLVAPGQEPPQAGGRTGGEPRFVMLETIHEYARERLQQSGEAEATERRHAEYFLSLAEESEPSWAGPSRWRGSSGWRPRTTT